MIIDKLFEKEVTVKVSVVKIDNKKLTKSIFNQLHYSSPFDSLFNLKENVKFLGYVNDDFRYLIWTNGEFIFKCNLNEFTKFRKIDLNKNTISDLHEVFPSEKVESLFLVKNEIGFNEYQDLQITQVLGPKYQSEILDKQENVEKIIKELLKRQIFV